MIIRQFEKKDASACCSIINACITAMTHLDSPSRFYLLSKNVPSDFYNTIKDDYALVAELHGQIVAIGAIKDNEIHTVFVSPDYQGNGIGEALMVSLEAELQARGVKVIQVHTPAHSIAFYEQLGYTKRKTQSKINLTSVELTKMSKRINKFAGV
ncbi:MAG: GNAT family N-acetyltransferase [Phototrophicaceae bacterium]